MLQTDSLSYSEKVRVGWGGWEGGVRAEGV